MESAFIWKIPTSTGITLSIIFRLLRLIRLELKALKVFDDNGVSPGEARKLQLTVQKDLGEPRDNEYFDEMYDLLSDEQIVVWMNDIEADQQYENWDVGIKSIMTNSMPGQLLRVRKNLFNLVFVLDFTDKEALRFLTEDIVEMLKNIVPIRFGVVPLITKQGDSDGILTS
jgi:UDP-glucose:glycoprotein glucosyltransferase